MILLKRTSTWAAGGAGAPQRGVCVHGPCDFTTPHSCTTSWPIQHECAFVRVRVHTRIQRDLRRLRSGSRARSRCSRLCAAAVMLAGARAVRGWNACVCVRGHACACVRAVLATPGTLAGACRARRLGALGRRPLCLARGLDHAPDASALELVGRADGVAHAVERGLRDARARQRCRRSRRSAAPARPARTLAAPPARPHARLRAAPHCARRPAAGRAHLDGSEDRHRGARVGGSRGRKGGGSARGNCRRRAPCGASPP